MISRKPKASRFVSEQVTLKWMSYSKAWLDFLEQPISQPGLPVPAGLSFLKVIQIRQKCFTSVCSFCLCVFSPEAIRDAFSSFHFRNPAVIVQVWLSENHQGSLQVQGQSELWGRLNRGGSASSPPHSAPSVEAATVIADNCLCNVWCLVEVVYSACMSCSLSYVLAVFQEFNPVSRFLSVIIRVCCYKDMSHHLAEINVSRTVTQTFATKKYRRWAATSSWKSNVPFSFLFTYVVCYFLQMQLFYYCSLDASVWK